MAVGIRLWSESLECQPDQIRKEGGRGEGWNPPNVQKLGRTRNPTAAPHSHIGSNDAATRATYTQSTSCSEALKAPKNAELMVVSKPRQELPATCHVGQSTPRLSLRVQSCFNTSCEQQRKSVIEKLCRNDLYPKGKIFEKVANRLRGGTRRLKAFRLTARTGCLDPLQLKRTCESAVVLLFVFAVNKVKLPNP